MGAALGNVPAGTLWSMQNGYAMCTEAGLRAIDERLGCASEEELDRLRGLLRIGLHCDVELTNVPESGRRVSQAFCSALPVQYSRLSVPRSLWRRFATLVLEAAYEATLCAARLNQAPGVDRPVFLTRLGGGVFGNDDAWIHEGLRRALELARDWDLDVRVVSYSNPSEEMRGLIDGFAPRR